MKRCNAYDEKFGPASDVSAIRSRTEFNVTMIDSAGLLQRLLTELRFVACELRRSWPELKNDPIFFARRLAIALADRLKRVVAAPNALAGVATALFLLLAATLSVTILGRITAKAKASAIIGDDPSQIVMLNISAPEPKTGSGVGAGAKGRVGFNHGTGEGSEAERKRSSGGGSGGNRDQSPPQQGRVPSPSAIPAPINPPLPNPELALAGVDLDRALWRNLPFPRFGDPRSKATLVSNGPGAGGGMGMNEGLGIGDGHGNGVGQGDDGNTGGDHNTRGGGGPGGAVGNDPRGLPRVLRRDELIERARVLVKPEPQYTEEARRTGITGTVVLRVVFSSSGDVTNIHAIKTLPSGLTEKAMAAARQIRFVPATKDGHPVSTYMQLEYNFNLF